MEKTLVLADYSNERHAADVVAMLNCYAVSPAGGGKPLSDYARDNLIATLQQLPHAFSVLCYEGETPVGLANCIWGFSTFKCRPLVNIHDLVVAEGYRHQGIGQLIMAKVEELAAAKGACKLTLEVLENNAPAKRAYDKFGFQSFELDPEYGQALFMEKSLAGE